MRFLFVLSAGLILAGRAYACETESSDCFGWGGGDPIVVKKTPPVPAPPPHNPCERNGSGTCTSTEGQQYGDGVQSQEASLATEDPPSPHSFTLPVAFTFHNFEQCTNDISAKAPEDGGVVHVPEGVSTEVFCRRLFPVGTSQTQVVTLQVTF
ncbi:MAG: hypothetical protein ACXVCK_19365, partial [Bdellovibrionota bacterium]